MKHTTHLGSVSKTQKTHIRNNKILGYATQATIQTTPCWLVGYVQEVIRNE